MKYKNSLKMTTVKIVKVKQLKDVILDLEEKMKAPVLSFVSKGKVAVLINGKSTTDLSYKIKPGDEIIALPVLRGG